MLSSRQAVVTKYGFGVVVHVSDVSSNVYVRVNNRAGAIYVFDRQDISPLKSIVTDDGNECDKVTRSSAGSSQTTGNLGITLEE